MRTDNLTGKPILTFVCHVGKHSFEAGQYIQKGSWVYSQCPTCPGPVYGKIKAQGGY